MLFRPTRLVPWALVTLASASVGCAVAPTASESSPTPAPAASSATPVEPVRGPVTPAVDDGQPINNPDDPNGTTLRPYVVSLNTQTSLSNQCTGVIVSVNQILTAAHCMFATNTHVQYYGPTGFEPMTAKGAWSTIQLPVAVPPGVTPGVESQAAISTTATDGYNQGDMADLALVTIPGGIPSNVPYAIVNLGTRGGYAPYKGKVGWEFGIGKWDGNINDDSQMRYVAVTPSSSDDSGGWFQTSEREDEKGDSGGPLLTKDANGNVTLVGILSGDRFFQTRFSSTMYGPTYDWITKQLTAGPPPPPKDRELITSIFAFFGQAPPTPAQMTALDKMLANANLAPLTP